LQNDKRSRRTNRSIQKCGGRCVGGRIDRGSEGLESEPSRRRRLIYLARGDRQLLFLTMPADINSQTFCRDSRFVYPRVQAELMFSFDQNVQILLQRGTGKIIYISTKGVV